MVVGNGLIASQFHVYQNNPDVVIIASGVSNSKETKPEAFKREFDLVKNCVKKYNDKIIVFFSTSSMYDPLSVDSPYVQHKLMLEEYLKETANRYYIFRVSQVIGRSLNNTLINYFISHINQGIYFEVWGKSTRNLICISDVFNIIDYIITNSININTVINIANKNNIPVTTVIQIIEKLLHKKANCDILPVGTPFDNIDISAINNILPVLKIDFNNASYYINSIAKIIEN